MLLYFLQIQNPVLGPGTDSFVNHSLQIIFICLGMFLFGWFLHHLIFCRQHKARIAELEGNLSSARTRITDLEGDLEGCNSAIVNIKGENAALSTKLANLEKTQQESPTHSELSQSTGTPIEGKVAEIDSKNKNTLISGLASDIAGSGSPGGFGVEEAKTVFGRKILEDDLKIVEGIGPKTEEMLNHNSIHTWKQLGNTSVPQLQSVLDKAGDRFQLLNPSTWPKQARMASEGEWVKLREYQNYLVGGVEPADKAPPNLSESSDVQYIMGKKIAPDDLTVVDGIGPKIQELLQNNGINTWVTLAQSEVSKLQELLDAAGDRYRMHNPATWPTQAAMAKDGKWDDLKEYQDFLDGGREPS